MGGGYFGSSDLRKSRFKRFFCVEKSVRKYFVDTKEHVLQHSVGNSIPNPQMRFSTTAIVLRRVKNGKPVM